MPLFLKWFIIERAAFGRGCLQYLLNVWGNYRVFSWWLSNGLYSHCSVSKRSKIVVHTNNWLDIVGFNRFSRCCRILMSKYHPKNWSSSSKRAAFLSTIFGFVPRLLFQPGEMPRCSWAGPPLEPSRRFFVESCGMLRPGFGLFVLGSKSRRWWPPESYLFKAGCQRWDQADAHSDGRRSTMEL